jgi:hypothetical protein
LALPSESIAIWLNVCADCMLSSNHMPLAMGVPEVHRVASLPSIALVAGDPPCDTDADGTQFVRGSAVSVPPPELLELLLPLDDPLVEEPLDEPPTDPGIANAVSSRLLSPM